MNDEYELFTHVRASKCVITFVFRWLPQVNIIVTRHVSQICLWTVGPLSSATCPRIFTQFTGCHQPVQCFYWSENTIDCPENANNIRNAICADTQTSIAYSTVAI